MVAAVAEVGVRQAIKPIAIHQRCERIWQPPFDSRRLVGDEDYDTVVRTYRRKAGLAKPVPSALLEKWNAHLGESRRRRT